MKLEGATVAVVGMLAWLLIGAGVYLALQRFF